MLLVSAAAAASVAVLDLDGFGTRHADTAALADGLRDAFVDDRLLDPLGSADMAAALMAGRDLEVRRARDLLAEARRNRLAANRAGCATAAEQAADILLSIGARYARRADLADAWFLQGDCLASAGRATEAWFVLDGVVRVYPDYVDARAAEVTPDVAAMMEQAGDRLLDARPTAPPAEWVASAVARLGVDYLVAGSVNQRGELTAWIFDREGQRGSAVEGEITWPPRAGDAAVAEIARALAQRVGVSPPEPPPRTREPSDSEALPVVVPLPAREPPSRAEHSERDARLVTRTWWFWSGLVLLASGGTTAIVLALPGEAPPAAEPAPTWSVHVPLD